MSRLVRNVFSNWVGLVLNMATAFFMSPFLVRSLGDKWYGLWLLIRSTTGYMGLVDGGLRISIVKYVARMDATADHTELNRVVSTAMAIYGGLMVVVIIGSFGLAAAFSHVFTVPDDAVPTARLVVLIAGISLAVSLGSAVYGGFIGGMQRYDISNGIGISTLILRTIAIVALVMAGYGIVALGIVHLVVQIATAVILGVVVYRLKPGLSISLRHANVSSGRLLYGYSFVILINTLADLLLFRTGEVLAGMYIGPEAVTYYGIAGTFAEYLQKIIITMVMVLHPYSSAKEATGDTKGLQTAVIIGTKFCLLIGLPATVIMIMLGTPFIADWMGPEYAVVSGPIMAVMAVGRLFWLAQSGTGQVLMGIGRHKQMAFMNAITGVLSFACGYALVREYGLFWMAAGAAAPLILMHGFVTPVYTMRVLGIPLRDYLAGGVLRPVLACVPFAIALHLLARFVNPTTILSIAGVCLVASPVFVLGCFFIAFDARERALWLGRLLPARLKPAAR